jgi:glycosyltransferase involved in cell wall biosynthesis
MTQHTIDLSIVTCAYNEEKNIKGFLKEVTDTLESIHPKISAEIVIVDDGSTDNTWASILVNSEDIVKRGKTSKFRVNCIKLISNYGQMRALEAGLFRAKGEYVLTIDSDLQMPPRYIAEFWDSRDPKAIIAGQQIDRKESFAKAYVSGMYYKLLSKISKHDIIMNSGDFRLYPKEFVNRILGVNLNYKVFRFLAPRMGLPIKVISFTPSKRIYGKSSYNLGKMIELAKNSVISLNISPTRIIGFYLSIFSIFFMINVIFVIYSFITGDVIPGWTSISVSISLGFMGILTSLYLVIAYMVKALESVQNLPTYVIQEIRLIE